MRLQAQAKKSAGIVGQGKKCWLLAAGLILRGYTVYFYHLGRQGTWQGTLRSLPRDLRIFLLQWLAKERIKRVHSFQHCTYWFWSRSHGKDDLIEREWSALLPLPSSIVVMVTDPVAVGTTDRLQQQIRQRKPNPSPLVCHCPLFFPTPFSIKALHQPDFFILGGEKHKLFTRARRWLATWDVPVVVMSRKEAEMVQQGGNQLLAMKQAFMREMAFQCEQKGIDKATVLRGMALHPQLGGTFLEQGVSGADKGWIKKWLVAKVNRFLQPSKHPIRITIWGDAPQQVLPTALTSSAHVTCRSFLPWQEHGPQQEKKMWQTLNQAHMLLITREHVLFRQAVPRKMIRAMTIPRIIDICGLYEQKEMAAWGIDYHGLGKNG